MRWKSVWITLAVITLLVATIGCTGSGGPSPAPSASVSSKPSAPTQSSQPVSPSAAAASGEPIKVGALLPFTGRYAPMGEPMKRAVELGEEYINKNGGIAGRPMKLVLYDDEGDQAKAAQLADKLISQDKVVAIIGPVPTANALAVAEIAERAKTIVFHVNPTKEVEANKKYIFGAAANDAIEIQRIILLFKRLGKMNVGLLHDANPYGSNFSGLFQPIARDAGLKITTAEKYASEDRDVTPQLTKIKNSGADVLLIAGTLPVPALAARQAKQLGLDVPIFGTMGIVNPEFPKVAGDAAEGVYSDTVMNVETPTPANKTLIDLVKAKYNVVPTANEAVVWDGLMAIKWAIEKAGGKTDGDSIATTLETAKGYEGVFGGGRAMSPTDHRGLTVNAVSIVQVKGGNWVIVPTN